MNAVVYYSNTGQSERIAAYLAEKTGDPLIELRDVKEFRFEFLTLVFPVYSQNLPGEVADFLRRAEVESLTAVATYGKMCHGNVLFEIRKKYRQNVIAAAYVPTKHAYRNDAEFECFEVFDALLSKKTNPTAAKIPRSYKNPLSDFAKGLRSRIGVKIIRDETRCARCGRCEKECPKNAMRRGVPNRNCIRCARCVARCPSRALRLKTNPPVTLYLKKRKTCRAEIYV